MSLEKVAQLANVSKATVSRVLNNYQGISSDRRAIVQRAIKEYGYVQKKNHNETKTKYKTIAVLRLCRDMFMEKSSAWFDMISGVEKILGKKNYSMLFSQIAVSGKLPQYVLEEKVDGLILSGLHPDKEIIEQISKFPATWISSRSLKNKDHVLANNEMAGQIAAKHLIDKGYKNLVCIDFFKNHPAVSTSCDYFEFKAYRKNCSAKRFRCDLSYSLEDTVENWDKLKQEIDNVISRIITEVDRPFGLFVPIGWFVEIVYDRLKAEGLNVGKDVEVVAVGCQNSAMVRLNPRPVSVDINAYEIGKRAVEQLLWRIEHPKEKARISIAIEPVLKRA